MNIAARALIVAHCLGLLACATEEAGHEAAPAHKSPKLTWDQVALGCSIMGEGEAAHVMCSHGHALNLRSENLHERWLYLKDKGVEKPNETELMHAPASAGHADALPEPLTPILRARLGERVRLRVISYGPQFHTFHLHGHLWLEGGKAKDTQTMGPAEAYDFADFFAGAGATSPVERAGVGDWMYHCHVETHAVTGMWGLFRVLAKDATTGLSTDGRFQHELPLPLGGTGTTVDVWVVAAEAPIAVARAYLPGTKKLADVERTARLFVPVEDEATFQAATANSIRTRLAPQKLTWTPWILSLRQGTKVRVHLRNVMPASPVTLHPHGVAYKHEHDGTNPDDVAKPGGAAVVYEWGADTAGTWPLHDHAWAIENVGRGLFGAIVVKSAEEEAALQRDYLVILHDFDMDWLMGLPEPSGASH